MILVRRARTLTSKINKPSTFRYIPFSSSSPPSSSRRICTFQAPPPSNDPSPNHRSRPAKEPISPKGCDYEHWLVVMDSPKGYLLRDEIVQTYVKTLASVLGSIDEAKKAIYSVSTKYYYAYGCKVSEDISYKIKSLPNVRWVLPDSYLHAEDKDYGGERFIDGKAVPYEDKYHADWLRNQYDTDGRVRRNGRRRKRGRSRNISWQNNMQQPRNM